MSLAPSTYYYRAEAVAAEARLVARIHAICAEFPRYGYRRVTAQLKAEGERVNHKRVSRIMGEQDLRVRPRRRFVVTTDSDHDGPIFPDLAKDLAPDGPDQLWVADLTYIRLLREFIYLAVVLDAYSRRCVGWALGRTLGAGLAVAALEMALETRDAGEGLVHHSDRGVQYASLAYTGRLRDRGVRISMSRRGNPYDNAKAERFMRTLKDEEVYMFEYDSLAEAEERIGTFLEEVYNQKRLHSAIGYVPPAEFEQALLQAKPA
jgi:putative transposase